MVLTTGTDRTSAGPAVQVGVTITRNPEPKRRINWPAVHAASRQIDAAKSELRRAADEARRSVEATTEYESAVATLRDAQAEYDLAVARVFSALEVDPAYIALDMQLQAASATIARPRHATVDNPNEAFQRASAVMKLRQQLTELRAAALDQDEDVERARYALIDAGMNLRRLREDAHARVIQSSAWQNARRQLDAARKQYASAG